MWEWFERYWPWIGIITATALIVVLFCTNTLRESRDVPRWRDPLWLSWSMVVAYMLHNFEEYGFDAEGRPFHFPATACHAFGFSCVQSCPFTPSFFVSVNVPFVWVVLPIAALCCRRNPAVGVAGAGLLLTNGMSHVIGLFTPMGYSPGTVTAAVILIPLGVWVFATCFGPGKLLARPLIAVNLLASILAQAVLLGLLLGLANNAIPLTAAIAIQTVDPVLLLILPWAASRKWPPAKAAAITGAHA